MAALDDVIAGLIQARQLLQQTTAYAEQIVLSSTNARGSMQTAQASLNDCAAPAQEIHYVVSAVNTALQAAGGDQYANFSALTSRISESATQAQNVAATASQELDHTAGGANQAKDFAEQAQTFALEVNSRIDQEIARLQQPPAT